MGMVWCYWAFPMERFCGAIARANKSQHYPYSSINRHILQVSQLSQIKNSYGLTEELDLEDRRHNIASGTQYGGYQDLVFVTPKHERPTQGPLINKITQFISKRTSIGELVIWGLLRDRNFVAWGKMQRIVQSYYRDITGGDLIQGNHIVCDNRETCDATHVKYWSKKSHWRWDRGPAIDIDEEIVSFRHAEQFIVIDDTFLRDLTKSVDAYYPHLNPLILAVISPIPYLWYIPESEIVQYGLRAGSYTSPEIVDASKIDSLVGHVITPPGMSYIVEWDSVVGQIDMLDIVVNLD
ncbi:hypothetical protein FRC10_005263 [Ceratobasidium sp. 414]|nr:hypothetical protein FRC10_005263 [Ceratobasidium sp. 414]